MRLLRHLFMVWFALALVATMSLRQVGCMVTPGGSVMAKFKQTRTMSAPAGRAIEARTINGSVAIRRGDKPDTTAITAKLALQSQERLDQTRVLAEPQSDGTLLVHIDWPGGRPFEGESCSLDIIVPPATNGGVVVKTSNGAVDLADLSGPARVDTSNGRITVATHAGEVVATTSNGAVEMTNVSGNADVHTSNGSVTLRDVAGRASVHTTNGRVTIALTPSNAGPLDVQTSNSSAEVKLPASYSGRMSLSTSNGSIHFPKNKPLQVIEDRKDKVSFQVGDSSTASTVSTTNGSVDVRIE